MTAEEERLEVMDRCTRSRVDAASCAVHQNIALRNGDFPPQHRPLALQYHARSD